MSNIRIVSNNTPGTCVDCSPCAYDEESNQVCETCSRICSGTLKIRLSKVWDTELLSVLLDDMDNISESSTESLQRRTKIRDIFSEWLFNHDMIECTDETEFVFEENNDEIDSAYHTAESNPTSHGKFSPNFPKEDLKQQIDSFNGNSYGLSMSIDENGHGYNGQIRIHLNLYRPVKMAVQCQDAILNNPESEDDEPNMCTVKTSAFQIPQNSSQVIHIANTTNTNEAVRKFLEKFSIIDNPCKFSLYESVDKGEGHASIRRVLDDEYPLSICLGWSAQGLNTRSFVLRENDSNEIQWDAFSIPELQAFLKILQREEDELQERIKRKYATRRETLRQHIGNIKQQQFANDKRTPVFV
ncbi:DgyrCDS4281 [Dimorphilus gyrociliatus]|uniref:DgyrCDS4281 n=1 Tax=Dimorphilus gyrociliatus TaxID=2664684 RepID=A0A7I8VIQ3_9ANNE|nr:DgyrCDS4281 [Dimorphilus gyrociliatus]